MDVLWVNVARLDLPLLVVICPLEDGPAPLAHEPLSHALNLWLGALGLGVEEHDLADTAGRQGLLLDGHPGQGGEDLALDVVGGQAAVGSQGLEEVLDGLQEVGLWVQDGVLDVLPVQQRHDLGQQLHLGHGGAIFVARHVVLLTCSLHPDLQVGDDVVELLLQILQVMVLAYDFPNEPAR